MTMYDTQDLAQIATMTGPNDLTEIAVLTLLMETPKQKGVYRTLAAVFWHEFALFLSVMQGKCFKVPSRSRIESLLRHARLWIYLKQRGLSDESVENAARVFGKGPKEIRNLFARIDAELHKAVEENNTLSPVEMQHLFDSLPLFGGHESEPEVEDVEPIDRLEGEDEFDTEL